MKPRPSDNSEAALAALLLYVTNPYAPPWRPDGRWRQTFRVPVRFELNPKCMKPKSDQRDGSYYAGLENTLYRIEIDGIDNNTIHFSRDGHKERFK